MGTPDNGEANGSQTLVRGCLTGRRSAVGSTAREACRPFAAQPGGVLDRDIGLITRAVGRDLRGCDFNRLRLSCDRLAAIARCSPALAPPLHRNDVPSLRIRGTGPAI